MLLRAVVGMLQLIALPDAEADPQENHQGTLLPNLILSTFGF